VVERAHATADGAPEQLATTELVDGQGDPGLAEAPGRGIRPTQHHVEAPTQRTGERREDEPDDGQRICRAAGEQLARTG
jgi:hypothetical protein